MTDKIGERDVVEMKSHVFFSKQNCQMGGLTFTHEWGNEMRINKGYSCTVDLANY